jgi:hypothetical protein
VELWAMEMEMKFETASVSLVENAKFSKDPKMETVPKDLEIVVDVRNTVLQCCKYICKPSLKMHMGINRF